MLKKVSLLLIASLVLLELATALSYFYEFRALRPAPVVAQEKLGTVWNNPSVRRCPEQEIWAPLPYLAFGRSWDLRAQCGDDKSLVNNRGMVGPDYPEVRDRDAFTILLTGGSGAERLGLQREGEAYYLEALFNRRFVAPKGKSFKVLIAANGDYRQPQNLISLALYHDLVDAVIDLSGHNELTVMNGAHRLEKPSELYWGLFASGQQAARKIEVRRLVAGLATSPCRFSYACVRWTEYRVQSKLADLGELRTYHSQRNFDHFPESVSEAQRTEIRLNKLHGYYRLMRATCDEMKLRCSFFLQPILATKANVHPDEKRFLPPDWRELRARYQDIVKRLPGHHSLTNLFDKTPGAAFMDPVHLRSAGPQETSEAYRIEARAIVEQAAKDWGLRATRGAP